MELALSVVAILVAVIALGLVLGWRNQLTRLNQELVDIRGDLMRSQGELDELKAATQIVPAPPLPRARSAGLTDLREQLRAAHRESESASEE
jgi:hypothetical protein